MDHKGEKLQHHYCKYGFCFVFFYGSYRSRHIWWVDW